MRIIRFIIISVFLLCIFHPILFAGIIVDGWKDPHAYRPSPVLFLHGFGRGNPNDWLRVDTKLNQYYSKYYTGYHSDPTVLNSTRYPYLELIDFGSTLIDRNSSVDTYKIGDRYVATGLRDPGDEGWADKLNEAVESIRASYQNRDNTPQKINLVSFSKIKDRFLVTLDFLILYIGTVPVL